MNKTPNILVLFTDQQRWDTMRAYGNSIIQTPNMDRLASSGVVFENNYTPAPLCTPARTCMASGLSAGYGGCSGNNRATNVDSNDTIMSRLSAVGYHTQAIGKLHFANSPYEESYGFDGMIISEETRGLRTAPTADDIVYDDYDKFLIENGMYGWDKPTEIGYNEIKPVANPLRKEFHITQWCGDETVEWLRSGRPADKPFFLFSSFVKPHVPYDCPRHLRNLYKPEDMPNPIHSEQDGTHKNPYLQSYINGHEFNLYSDLAAKRALCAYYANITFIDEQIGRILDELEAQGLAEDTLILFSSDHGDMMGDHGLWYKCFGYEGSIHTPLIASWKGHLQAGARVRDLTSLLDFYPTLMNLTGQSYDSSKRPGGDLLSYCNGTCKNDLVVSEILKYPMYLLHVRWGRWKYLFHQNGGFEELYDLETDPRETIDLTVNPAYNEVKAQIKQRAERWILDYSDPQLALDENGCLKALPLNADATPGPMQTFSRMPWESRVPPCEIPEGGKLSNFWQKQPGDWHSVLEKVLK